MKLFRGTSCVVIFTIILSCFAYGDAEEVIGKWQCDNVILEFYGDGIAKENETYLQYSFPDEQHIIFNYGNNQEETLTFQITNQLILTDENQETKIFNKVETSINQCVRNLHKLKGAKALFHADNPYESEPIIIDLVPQYLPSLPVCPDGGIYSLKFLGENPACSIDHHFIE